MNTKIIIDFETRSKCNLKKCGAWKYAEDPTTEVLCLAYKVNGGLGLWANSKFLVSDFYELDLSKFPTYILDYYPLLVWHEKPFIIEAHNAQFERAIWEKIMVPRYGWPSIPLRQWRCSAAKCSAAALPRKLEDACTALGLSALKDAEGHGLMLKMCKPRKPSKKEKIQWANTHLWPHDYLAGIEKRMPTLWHEKPEDLLRLFRYCIQDVEAEYCLSQAVRDLSPEEQELWFLDQEINERGINTDTETVKSVLGIIEVEENKLLEELSGITDGTVSSPRQVAASLEWLKAQGAELPNLQRVTVEEYLKNE